MRRMLDDPEAWARGSRWSDLLTSDQDDVSTVMETCLDHMMKPPLVIYLWLMLPPAYAGQRQVFSIGPRMRQSISAASLDIPVEAVRPPYETFYVELGKSGEALVPEGEPVRGIAVRWGVLDEPTEAGNIAALQVMWVYGDGSKGFGTVPAAIGQTWEEALDPTTHPSDTVADDGAESLFGPEMLREALRTVVGLGLYLGGREPDIETEVRSPDKRHHKLRKTLSKLPPGSRQARRTQAKLDRYETRLKVCRHFVSPVGERVLARWQRSTRAAVLVRSFFRRYYVGPGRKKIEWRHIAEHTRGSGKLDAVVRRYKGIFER